MAEIEAHAKHSLKKFIIATAISIIKSKPDNITTKDYCLSLQSRIKNGENSNITNDSLNFGVNLEEFLEISDLNCSVSTKDLSTQQLRKFGSSETKKRTQLNLQIIYAVREIKNMINYQKGTNFSSSQESFFESFMDSGFLSDKSQKYLNEGYKVEKKINDVDQSLTILINFLRETLNDQSQGYLHNNISQILGSAIDILFEQNIHMPSISKCVDTINKTIDKILNTANEHMTVIWKNELKSLYGLNDSIILIQQTIRELCKRLNNYLSKLKSCDDNREIQPIEIVDNLSITFTLIEELLDKYSVKKSERKENNSPVDKSTENESHISNKNKILNQNWNLSSSKPNNSFNLEEFEDFITNTLNHVALECIESYPLFSFWAMECLNNNKVHG